MRKIHEEAEYERELSEFGVVLGGLGGLEKNEEASLYENLVTNAKAIDELLWLEFLTSQKHLVRLAKVQIDESFLARMPYTSSQRRMMHEDQIYPIYDNGDNAVVCATIHNSAEFVTKWEAALKSKIILVAPTLRELGEIQKEFL